MVGTTLGHYTVIARLGAGGMGEVYRAHDGRLDRQVAVKVLSGDIAASVDRVSRFRAEARAVSALNHPHIVVIHDVGDLDGQPFIVTELVEGETLRDRLAARALGVREAIDIGRQVASALAAAHERGIVHRDIKPENIMVRPDGYVKVLDFGLAKLASEGTSSDDETQVNTRSGVIVGTPQYMSPEQAAGTRVDFRSDQFSFGVVLYELLTGRNPFRRSAFVLSAAAVMSDEPEPLSRLCPDVPLPLRWAIERCLAKRPGDRFASTAELSRDLDTVHARIADVHQQPATLAASNLSAPAAMMVGRAAEVAAVTALIERPDVRWVTLTGPGGVGKTRLAVETARQAASRIGAQVFVVPLVSVQGVDQVATAIAQVLGLRPDAQESAAAALRRGLATIAGPIVIVLDTFEHVAEAALLISELVDACLHLKVLVTSRARLHVSAEYEFQVAPLALPARGTRDPAALLRTPAVALFVERARAARSDFALTPANAEAVADICAALDGLPLAIELAAAHVRLLPPPALFARLSGRSLSLGGGARDLPAHQQTLRGTIDWGYELLPAAEQRLFRRLAVFVDGWTLESAEAVADAGQDLGMDIFDGLASLVDKSLVQPLATRDGEPRFTMLSTVRAYARERLDQAGEAALAQKAHAAYALVLAEEGTAAEAAAQARWLDQCDQDYGNLRAAIDHLVLTRQAEWAMRLTTALLPYWQTRARLTEARECLTRALALAPAGEVSDVRARALFAMCTLGAPMGDPGMTLGFAQQARELYRALGDRQGQAVALNALGVSHHALGQWDEARGAFEEAIVIWREMSLGAAAVRSMMNLASVAADAGDSDQAIAIYRQARAVCLQSGDEAGLAWALNGEGQVEFNRGSTAAARVLYSDAAARFEQLRDGWGAGDSLLALADLECDAGNPFGARALLERAREMFERVGEMRGTARVIEAGVRLAAQEGEPERALRLAGAAAALRRTLMTPLARPARERLDRVLEDVRSRLDAQRAAEVWMEGWSLPAGEAMRIVLGA